MYLVAIQEHILPVVKQGIGRVAMSLGFPETNYQHFKRGSLSQLKLWIELNSGRVLGLEPSS